MLRQSMKMNKSIHLKKGENWDLIESLHNHWQFHKPMFTSCTLLNHFESPSTCFQPVWWQLLLLPPCQILMPAKPVSASGRKRPTKKEAMDWCRHKSTQPLFASLKATKSSSTSGRIWSNAEVTKGSLMCNTQRLHWAVAKYLYSM